MIGRKHRPAKKPVVGIVNGKVRMESGDAGIGKVERVEKNEVLIGMTGNGQASILILIDKGHLKMRVEQDDFGTGWFQLHIAIRNEEIDSLIELLNGLKSDPQQHFHLSSDYAGEGGIGDIEFYIQGDDEQDNMMMTSPAVSPNR